jgi:hypothetical protein
MKKKQKNKPSFFVFATTLLMIQGCREEPQSPCLAHPDPTITHFFKRTNGWVAGDVGFSIPLPAVSGGTIRNDQRLWLFGDSYIGNYDSVTQTVPCLFQVHNAGLLQTPKTDFTNATTLLDTTPTTLDKSYFKNSDWTATSRKQLWTGHGYADCNNIYVYLQGVIPNTDITVLGGKAIYNQTATNPYGPFANEQKIWDIDDKNSQGNVMFNYYPIAHPEMDNQQNELLITYSVNGCRNETDCPGGRRDPNTYRPRAIRVPYKWIDSGF